MTGRYRLLSLNLFLILISLTGQATAISCSDSNDCGVKLKALSNLAIYGDYPELKTIQSQTLSTLQARTFDKNTKEYVEIILTILDSFGKIHTLSTSDSLENRENAIIQAESLYAEIERLENYKEPQEKFYPLLTKISIRKFFKEQSEYFANKANNEKKTDTKIKYLLNEARAYKNTGDPKYAEISYRAEALRSEYDRDINLIKGSIQESTGFINDAGNTEEGFFASIELFARGFHIENDISNANQLSNSHQESQLETQGNDQISKVRSMKNDAAASVIKYIILIIIIYLAITLYFSWSITRWKDEINNVDSGNDLLEGLILE